jgi:hypothetical protein
MTYKAKSKLVHESFRIEEEVLETLEKEARKKGTSLSYLVNTVLKNYVNSDRYFQELGFILMSKDFLRKSYSRIQAEDLADDAKELGGLAKEYISYFFLDVNTYTLLEFLELWFSKFQSFQHKVDVKCHQFCLNHDINMNFSTYFSIVLKELIEPIISRPIKILIVTPNSLAFSFEIE